MPILCLNGRVRTSIHTARESRLTRWSICSCNGKGSGQGRAIASPNPASLTRERPACFLRGHRYSPIRGVYAKVMKSVATQSGFTGSVAAVRQETLAFKGEVVMVAGDTYYMWVDKALTDVFPGFKPVAGRSKEPSASSTSLAPRSLVRTTFIG